jgi:hypothetical protein
MSTQVQWRRGTDSEIAAFTGADGEITVNTTNYTLNVHDGVTAGGFAIVGTTATQALSNKTLSGNTTISGNLIPGANITYSLGTSTARFKDLWLAGNTIYLDGANISVVNGNIVFYNTQGASVDIGSLDSTSTAFQTYANTKIGTNSNSNLVVLSTTATTSATTGALVVRGGVGIAGNVIVGGTGASSLRAGAFVTDVLNLDPGTSNIASRFGKGAIASGTGIIGWNRSAGRGEMSFVQNKNGGSQGGFVFYDWANTAVNTTTEIFAITETGNISVFGNITPNANVIYDIGSPTSWFNTFYGVSTQARYADLAENYQADDDYEPGAVLVFGGTHEVTISTQSHDTTVAGVVSTSPAHLMNGALQGHNVVALALQGRVPCRVQGPVNKGTVLVSSSIPGTAEAIDYTYYQPGSILGKSLEQIEDNSIRTIEIVVGRF